MQVSSAGYQPRRPAQADKDAPQNLLSSKRWPPSLRTCPFAPRHALRINVRAKRAFQGDEQAIQDCCIPLPIAVSSLQGCTLLTLNKLQRSRLTHTTACGLCKVCAHARARMPVCVFACSGQHAMTQLTSCNARVLLRPSPTTASLLSPLQPLAWRLRKTPCSASCPVGGPLPCSQDSLAAGTCYPYCNHLAGRAMPWGELLRNNKSRQLDCRQPHLQCNHTCLAAGTDRHWQTAPSPMQPHLPGAYERLYTARRALWGGLSGAAKIS
eukprot:scaffold16173_cov21-Tisochrysis_lutea.AAC.3